MNLASITIKLPPALKVDLENYCLTADSTTSQLLRHLIKEFLEKQRVG